MGKKHVTGPIYTPAVDIMQRHESSPGGGGPGGLVKSRLTHEAIQFFPF